MNLREREREQWILSTPGKCLPLEPDDLERPRRGFEGLEGEALEAARKARKAEQLRAMRKRARENYYFSPYQRVVRALRAGLSVWEAAEQTGVALAQVGRWSAALRREDIERLKDSEKAEIPENF